MSVFSRLDTRVFLWSLFLLQICLIGLILGFGSILYCSGDCDSSTGTPPDFSIQFVTSDKSSQAKKREEIQILGEFHLPGKFQFLPIGNSSETFVAVTSPIDANDTLWCFREGTVSSGDSGYATEIDEKFEGVVRCKCKSEWHGPDCGQPEAVWRSLFAAKAQVSTERRAKNIFYIIRTTEFSLETLEIQIMELINVVDIFILCFEAPVKDPKTVRRFLSNREHLKEHSKRIFLKFEEKSCVSKSLLAELEKSLSRSPEDDDMVLLSGHDEILNSKAINYLKWYNDGHDLFRFRLKHLVYGFFWQHPSKTTLKSVMVRYKLLQSNYQLEELENHSPALVIGNLNHFGGWFCQLCYQPLEMISFLVREMNTREDLKRGHGHRSGVIDEEFATKLIANGVNIYELLAREVNFEKAKISDGGGPMDLVKMYPSAERHYSPVYVQRSRGKFENLVKNPFARWELDVMDDYNYYN